MTEDYKKGYREGFYDGWFAGNKAAENLNKSSTGPISYPYTTSLVCYECGMEWKGAMGYVCSNQKCPVQPKVT